LVFEKRLACVIKAVYFPTDRRRVHVTWLAHEQRSFVRHAFRATSTPCPLD
jgi:hypothetical protein